MLISPARLCVACAVWKNKAKIAVRQKAYSCFRIALALMLWMDKQVNNFQNNALYAALQMLDLVSVFIVRWLRLTSTYFDFAQYRSLSTGRSATSLNECSYWYRTLPNAFFFYQDSIFIYNQDSVSQFNAARRHFVGYSPKKKLSSPLA